jgi:hypothetical protein
MNRKPSLLRDLFSMFGAANAAAAATHENRTPRASDLRTLGIDPRHYHAISR